MDQILTSKLGTLDRGDIDPLLAHGEALRSNAGITLRDRDAEGFRIHGTDSEAALAEDKNAHRRRASVYVHKGSFISSCFLF